MANNFKQADATVNAAVDAVTALLNGGKLLIYSGEQPATADTAIDAQTLLAQLTFGNPAFGSAVAGVATAEAITEDSSANADGTAAWFRATTSADAKVFDGTVGESGCDLTINSDAIQEGATVSQTGTLTYTLPKSA